MYGQQITGCCGSVLRGLIKCRLPIGAGRSSCMVCPGARGLVTGCLARPWAGVKCILAASNFLALPTPDRAATAQDLREGGGGGPNYLVESVGPYVLVLSRTEYTRRIPIFHNRKTGFWAHLRGSWCVDPVSPPCLWILTASDGEYGYGRKCSFCIYFHPRLSWLPTLIQLVLPSIAYL